MTLDQHAIQLSKLMGSFHALEFLLRGFLQKLPTARPIGIPSGTDLYSFPIGTELPENEFTSYDSLGELIDKCNSELNKRGLTIIDKTLIEVRDALAHGRVSAASATGTMRLIKFDRPVNARVRVAFNEQLSESWFVTQRKRVNEAIRSVRKGMP